MRRETLVKALGNVDDALRKSKAAAIFSYLGRAAADKESRPASFLNDCLNGYAAFMLAYEKFGPAEKEILSTFQIDEIVLAETWVSPVRNASSGISLVARIRFVLETFSKFTKLLARDIERFEFVVPASEKSEKALATKKLTFLIRELEQPALTLKDLGAILGDVESLFQIILKIEGISSSDLIVVSMDSGSEKSLDVIGIATAVDKLSNLILESWDRIRFARSSKLRASIKTASEGLTVLNELKVSQEKGAISAEEAEKLKRSLLKAVDDLFLKGVYTSAMQESVAVQPSQLEFQRTKLLANYSGPVSTSDNSSSIDDAEVDEAGVEPD